MRCVELVFVCVLFLDPARCLRTNTRDKKLAATTVSKAAQKNAPFNMSPEKLVGLSSKPPPAKPGSLFFIHIPKNAGSSIAKEAYEHDKERWGHSYDARMVLMPTGEQCYWNHIPPQELQNLKLKNPYAETETFCTVQHPYERMLSMYRFGLKSPEFSGGMAYNFKPICTPNALNKWIQTTARSRMVGTKYSAGCTLFSQAEYIYGKDGKQWCQNILRMEEFPSNFNTLMEKHGKHARLEEHANPSKDACPELSVRDIDRTSKELVQKLWPDDFAKLGFWRNHKLGDLAFVHVPFNFGHTVEMVALLDEGTRNQFQAGVAFNDKLGFKKAINIQEFQPTAAMVATARSMHGGSEAWGHFNTQLQKKNAVTGCPMYWSPPKYWSKEHTSSYFGNRTVFGLLRDPYERLVSMFRGDISGYGGMGKFHETCDVNGGIKHILSKYINGNSEFSEDCTLLPQAEFFDGPYGIKLAIDNRRFPLSVNEALKEHGYKMHIRPKDVLHVKTCEDVWAGDLDQETKMLVKKVYARDFELICKHFGHCDQDENTCLTHVEGMCPPKAFKWTGTEYVKKE